MNDEMTDILKLETFLGINWNNISTKFSKKPRIIEDIKAANGGGQTTHCGTSTSSTLTMEFFVAIADNSWVKSTV